MMRTFVLTGLLAQFCTAITAPAVFAQGIEVVGLDGKPTSVTLATLERRTVVTQDRGLRAEFQGVALRDVLMNRLEVRDLR